MAHHFTWLALGLAFAAAAPHPAIAAPPPVACALRVFTPAEAARHAELTRRLIAAITSRRARADGWTLSLADGRGRLGEVAEWISLERRCCPFLAFQLEVREGSAIVLALTGPPGTREVLAEALAGPAVRVR